MRSYELLGIDLLPRKRIMGWRAKRVRVAFILENVVVVSRTSCRVGAKLEVGVIESRGESWKLWSWACSASRALMKMKFGVWTSRKVERRWQRWTGRHKFTRTRRNLYKRTSVRGRSMDYGSC